MCFFKIHIASCVTHLWMISWFFRDIPLENSQEVPTRFHKQNCVLDLFQVDENVELSICKISSLSPEPLVELL